MKYMFYGFGIYISLITLMMLLSMKLDIQYIIVLVILMLLIFSCFNSARRHK